MILFSEILGILEGAEFNQLSIVDGDGGEARVDRKEYNRIIRLLNAGLDVLHQRFELAKNTIQIQTTKGQVKYTLDSSNALSKNSDGFIIDSLDDPYENDLIEIMAVHAPNGRELLLNNHSEHVNRDGVLHDVSVDCLHASLYTLDYRTLRVPPNLMDTVLTIHYRSSGKKLKPLADPLNDPIDDLVIHIPVSYMNALTFYIASRVYNSKGAETIGRGIFHEGNNYQTKFEQECTQLKASGFESDVMISDNSSFYNRGFV